MTNAQILACALKVSHETHPWAFRLTPLWGCEDHPEPLGAQQHDEYANWHCAKCRSMVRILRYNATLTLPDPCVDTPEARRAWLADVEQEKRGFLVVRRYSTDNWEVTFRGKNAARFTGEDPSRYLASVRAFCAAHGVELNWEDGEGCG